MSSAPRSDTVVILGRSARKPELLALVHRPYAASKAALYALVGTLAAELAPLNIRVLDLAPFRTAITRRSWTECGDPVKAMHVLVDMVRGEGVAQGKA
ncbi:hypothetical protein B0H15DRAFT_953596 [Mycena belliarum]|uniref:Uncharacterized protein n=1 Tax=Mycena belliarum TaxID=1033014 RepID=A0AAD6TY51_9AGAR|nr:hypothetical protein B0H15DRAFT_953596 [Mycena belliae]